MNSSRALVMMPLYNEAQHLPRVLQSIERQTLERERMYFVAIDGNSTDGSAEVVRRWLTRSGIAGRVLWNPRRSIPTSLNLALSLAKQTDVVVRLDAHAVYGPEYLSQAITALEESPADVACVGCTARPAPATRFAERIVAALYTNVMGLGSDNGRVYATSREADSVYLGAWRPGVLQEAGGFNETMKANEDGELSARLRQCGYRILRVPLPCRFLIKRGPAAAIRQFGRYGYWRAKMLQRNPAFIRLRHVLPPVALLCGLAVLFTPLRFVLAPLFGAYALLIFRAREQGEPLPVTLTSVVYFPIVQSAFATGMVCGFLTGRGIAWPPQSPTESCIRS
jgi:glycosyltransferase involved in cell wall biosynthesis